MVTVILVILTIAHRKSLNWYLTCCVKSSLTEMSGSVLIF
jgi:hypothetical protein